MRKFISLLIAVGCLFYAKSQVSNIRVVQEQTETIYIYYDLVQTRDIKLLVSLDNGKTYLPELQKVSGSVGKNVPAGKDRKIVWHHLDEIGYIDGKQLKFKIGSAIDKEQIMNEINLVFKDSISQNDISVAQFAAFVYATGYLTTAEIIGYDWVLHKKESLVKQDKKNVRIKTNIKENVNWRHDAYGNLVPESDFQQPVLHLSCLDIIAFCEWCEVFPPSIITEDCQENDTLENQHSQKMVGFKVAQTQNAFIDIIHPKIDKKINKEKPIVEKIINYEKKWFTKANVSYSILPQWAYGISFGQIEKWGWYVDLMSNFNFKGLFTKVKCNHEGFVENGDDSYVPFFSDKVSSFRFSLSMGALYKVHPTTAFYLGVGYGYRGLFWETIDNDWVNYTDNTFHGVNAECGLLFDINNFVLSAGVSTVNFKMLEMKIGFGYAF